MFRGACQHRLCRKAQCPVCSRSSLDTLAFFFYLLHVVAVFINYSVAYRIKYTFILWTGYPGKESSIPQILLSRDNSLYTLARINPTLLRSYQVTPLWHRPDCHHQPMTTPVGYLFSYGPQLLPIQCTKVRVPNSDSLQTRVEQNYDSFEPDL